MYGKATLFENSQVSQNAKIYGDEFLQSERNGILLCNWCHDHVNEIKWVQDLKKSLIK